ncbi:hypothetical protein EPN87_01925 [archaeon]|nr:MAG: hypothetical protein EPN87_01925 [archaeon]
MECLRCKSPKIIKFVDGFGEKRLFCRGCWGSFIEQRFVDASQTRLPQFNTEAYYRLGGHDLL